MRTTTIMFKTIDIIFNMSEKLPIYKGEYDSGLPKTRDINIYIFYSKYLYIRYNVHIIYLCNIN